MPEEEVENTLSVNGRRKDANDSILTVEQGTEQYSGILTTDERLQALLLQTTHYRIELPTDNINHVAIHLLRWWLFRYETWLDLSHLDSLSFS